MLHTGKVKSIKRKKKLISKYEFQYFTRIVCILITAGIMKLSYICACK